MAGIFCSRSFVELPENKQKNASHYSNDPKAQQVQSSSCMQDSAVTVNLHHNFKLNVKIDPVPAQILSNYVLKI